jgi:hypothetical protein
MQCGNEQVGELEMSETLLLTVDGAVNLALGLLLVFLPRGFAKLVGIPIPPIPFYPIILGGVLVGIGLALFLQCFWGRSRVTGLGLEGAIAINLCGAGVLVALLIGGNLNLPIRGYAFLWCIAVLVLSIAVVELLLRGGERTSK